MWLCQNIQGTEQGYKKVGETCPGVEEGANAILSSCNKAPLQGGKWKGAIINFLHEMVTWVHLSDIVRPQNTRSGTVLLSLYQARQHKVICNTAKAEMDINNHRRFSTAKKGSSMTAPKYGTRQWWRWSTVNWSDLICVNWPTTHKVSKDHWHQAGWKNPS